MKKIAIMLLIVLLIIAFLILKNKLTNPLNSIKNFKVYYGDYELGLIDNFNQYDLLILEPNFYNKSDISNLKNKTNTCYIGYLSVFEVSNWDKELISLIHEKDYLIIDGKKIKNETYNNFIGNINNKTYRKVLMTIVEDRITNKNFDGIFLDTVDWIDFYNNNPDISKNMLEGYEKFLKDIKELYPDLIIIQNRGFKSLKNFSYKYIDGIVWENFNYKKTFKEDKYITSNLIFQNQFKGIKVFTISHTDYNENKKLSNKLNWIYMKNKNSYSIWPD